MKVFKSNYMCINWNTKFPFHNQETQKKKGSIFFLFYWWATRLEHFFHQVESYTSFGFILSNGDVIQEIKMSHVGSKAIAMLVGHPIEPRCVGMPSSNVLRL